MTMALDAPRPVRAGEALDAARLEAYLRGQFPDTDGPLVVEQFTAGYSNLTYLVRWAVHEMILRRPPFGNQVKSAHDMGREYRVLARLSRVYPLAPRPYAYCQDEDVLGAPFYLMERRHGIILRQEIPETIELDAVTLHGLSRCLIERLAELHQLDYRQAGLEEVGRPTGYVERQIIGWTKRFHQAKTDADPRMDRVADWLADQRPEDQAAALIHNDYKYDNLMLDPNDIRRIVAVLDWEMTTIGDPLMDLGVTLAYWVDPDDPPRRQATAFGPTHRPGSMTRRELLAHYARSTGRELPDMLFYYVYGLFKLAVIVQQIYARYARGYTQDDRFAELHQMVAILEETATQAIDRGVI